MSTKYAKPLQALFEGYGHVCKVQLEVTECNSTLLLVENQLLVSSFVSSLSSKKYKTVKTLICRRVGDKPAV